MEAILFVFQVKAVVMLKVLHKVAKMVLLIREALLAMKRGAINKTVKPILWNPSWLWMRAIDGCMVCDCMRTILP